VLSHRECQAQNTLSADLIEELEKGMEGAESQRPTGGDSVPENPVSSRADVNDSAASRSRAVEPQIGRAHAVIDRSRTRRIPNGIAVSMILSCGGLEVAAGLADAD